MPCPAARWTRAPAPSSPSAGSPAPTAPPPSTTPLRVPHLASCLVIRLFSVHFSSSGYCCCSLNGDDGAHGPCCPYAGAAAEVVTGSSAWIGRGLSCVCAQRRDSDARLSFDLTPTQVRFACFSFGLMIPKFALAVLKLSQILELVSGISNSSPFSPQIRPELSYPPLISHCFVLST